MHTPALGTIFFIFFIALATVGISVAKAIMSLDDWQKVRKWSATAVALGFAWSGLLGAVCVYGTDVLGQLFIIAFLSLCALGWVLQGGRPSGW